MMEMDMIYRLSVMVGFLTAAVLILLVVALVVGVCAFQKAMLKDAFQALDEIEKIEEGTSHENNP